MSEQRRHRLRLEISREAARLFWAHGVDGTSGDQIADAVGLSTRTIWRHFRSKESCAEPIVTQSVAWEMTTLREWPPHLSLEEHFEERSRRFASEADPLETADIGLGVRMIRLGDTEPAIRTAWLMACDQLEREMAEIVATRLGLAVGDLEVRLHAAAASASLRVINEYIGAALLDGVDPREFADSPARIARAVRRATAGAVGDPVVPSAGAGAGPGAGGPRPGPGSAGPNGDGVG
ncbi:TetR/AcrR family transcriptional regulator [Streptomyces sp. XM4193]|uniref:TetR/AcrR family transcriptional regulator n=1 Tax=Streptomyces sp. XM4193 TaxID=2929782 RepID=UPI001FFAD063|nr:TetR/AcrR family transcriptional regulator [Streptomyces sp. XM4193]MCK1797049.1 TetR/AcrR family transcriptional regulator [Streptomyces sp. XM4193]